MPSKHFHYLRNERRDAGLTQADVAVLLGAPWKQYVARYERGRVLPPLEIVLGYEAVMRRPVAELFTGMYEQIADGVRQRARDLLAKADVANTALRARRKRSLQRILE
jgi:transcriptional regulator with XRE-family HTH domain